MQPKDKLKEFTEQDPNQADLINTVAQSDAHAVTFCGKRLLADDDVYLTFELSSLITLEKCADFPHRVEVDIVSDKGDCYPLGVALKTDKNCLKMPTCTLRLQGDAVALGYHIRFRHLSHILDTQSLITAIDDGVPWIFTLDNDEWLLIGTASIRTRAKVVRILYPEALTCSIAEPITLAGKYCIEASGVIDLYDTRQHFCIQTDQAQNTPHYELRGKTLAGYALRTLQTVYLGLPELWCIDSETGQRSKVSTPLLVRPVNSQAAWQALNKQQGIYELCLQDTDDNILFRKKCALLPEAFALRFLPATHSPSGRIDIVHNGQAYISCDSPLVVSINATAEGRSIEFDATGTQPGDVDLILRWSRNDRLILTVPFPVCSFQDSHEKPESFVQENEALNTRIENLTVLIKKRDDALRLLLNEVKNLNAKIRDVRSQ